MSSASQLLFGNVQGKALVPPPPNIWTPAELFVDGAFGLWYDFTDSDKVLNSSSQEAQIGEDIYTVSDQSPFNENLTSVTGTYGVAALDGDDRQYIDFSLGDAVYSVDDISTASDYTLFTMGVIVNRDTDSLNILTAYRYVESNPGVETALALTDGGTNLVSWGRGPNLEYIETPAISMSSQEKAIVGSGVNGNTEILTTYKNNEATSVSGISYTPIENMNYYIGGRLSQSTVALRHASNSDYYEAVVMWGRYPTPEEITLLKEYLSRHF